MNKDHLSTKLNIKTSTLDLLEANLFHDIYEWLSNSENEFDFWEKLNNLDPNLISRVNIEESTISSIDKSFIDESISHIFCDFFEANCISSGSKIPHRNTITSNITSKNLMLKCFKDQTYNFTLEKENVLYRGSSFCSLNDFQNMCNVYLNDGFTWCYYPDKELRDVYNSIATFVIKHSFCTSVHRELIIQNLKNLAYHSHGKFHDDMLHIIDKEDLKHIPTFHLDQKLLNDLHEFMDKIIEENQKVNIIAPYHPINDRTLIRTENLVNQMLCSFSQRSAFSITPQIVGARLGHEHDINIFEQSSLSELLTCNQNGEANFLPFQDYNVILPDSDSLGYRISVIKRYICLALKDNSINRTYDTCLDILSEFLLESIKQIGFCISSNLKGQSKEKYSEIVADVVRKISVSFV